MPNNALHPVAYSLYMCLLLGFPTVVEGRQFSRGKAAGGFHTHIQTRRNARKRIE